MIVCIILWNLSLGLQSGSEPGAKLTSETLGIALAKIFGRVLQQTNPDGKHSNPARGLGGTIGGRVRGVVCL
jgi:hypothetical protein